jgi:hypothetical protein
MRAADLHLRRQRPETWPPHFRAILPDQGSDRHETQFAHRIAGSELLAKRHDFGTIGAPSGGHCAKSQVKCCDKQNCDECGHHVWLLLVSACQFMDRLIRYNQDVPNMFRPSSKIILVLFQTGKIEAGFPGPLKVRASRPGDHPETNPHGKH